jgi:hypothetical protein
VYRRGDEAAWWQKAGIDGTAAARALWLETHPTASETGLSNTADFLTAGSAVISYGHKEQDVSRRTLQIRSGAG